MEVCYVMYWLIVVFVCVCLWFDVLDWGLLFGIGDVFGLFDICCIYVYCLFIFLIDKNIFFVII